MSEIADRYDPTRVEPHWYGVWEERGYFHADVDSPKKPYCIVIPPPNVTGTLHIGHAFTFTLQDILIRYKRMDVYNALWMPGTDHAGIATQYVVEQQLAKEGKTKEDLGREAFIARVWKWKEESGGTIIRQLKSLGASCDWARLRFTMDAGLSAAVREVFVRLWEEGLIYQGDYIVNWCPRCQTVLSDLEVEREEQDAEFVYIKYGPLTLGTVRPETKLGDTAVAVHPKDRRYRKYVGKTLEVPSVEGNITLQVVADSAVDPKFGTGVIKVTPGHDATDFEIGRRHNLPIRSVIGFDGKMTALAGKYAGLDRFETRKRIVEDMQALGLIDRIEPYRHAVGVCYRCRTVVEPLVSKQWYVRTTPLAEPAVKAVRDGRMRIIPRGWRSTYFVWMENILDWCISRQLWWGHRIPVWYCDRDGSLHVSRVDLSECPQCGGPVRQDTDVLDTWFSSGLWPLSTLGWPKETPELKTFYPTSCLVTGFDILFFWVARMAMFGLKFAGDVPFRDVYIHALVRDAEGQKMSKSKGNVIDPLQVMDKYGTDALRFTLAAMASPGRDIKLSEERIEGYRNFANKLWNAARFILMNLEGPRAEASVAERPVADRWILSRMHRCIGEVTASLEAYRFDEAANTLYHFIWHEYCDWYVELAKPALADKASRQAALTRTTLIESFETLLRLLHPFMPFITEEIWQAIPHDGESIMIAPYPTPNTALINEDVGWQIETIQSVVSGVRDMRGVHKAPSFKNLTGIVRVEDEVIAHHLEANRLLIMKLAGLSDLKVKKVKGDDTQRPTHAATGSIVLPGGQLVEIIVPLPADTMDIAREITQKEKRLKELTAQLKQDEKKLSNPDFVTKVPPDVLKKTKARHEECRIEHQKLSDELQRLRAMAGGAG